MRRLLLSFALLAALAGAWFAIARRDDSAPAAILSKSASTRERAAEPEAPLATRREAVAAAESARDAAVPEAARPTLAGIVVDADGAPLGGVELALVAIALPVASSALADPYATTTGSDGRFEFFAAFDVPCPMTARLAGYVVALEPLIAIPGALGLRIEMARSGTFAGRVLLDPAAASAPIVVRLADGGRARAARIDADGSFRVDEVSEGTQYVSVHLEDDMLALLARFDDVEVHAGGESRDARLDPLDLRGVLRSIELRVTDEHGAPVRELAIGRGCAGDGRVRFGPPLVSDLGRFRVFGACESFDVDVWAAGFRTVRLTDVRENSAIVMPPGLPVRVTLAGELAALVRDWRLEVVLRPREVRHDIYIEARAAVGPDGFADLFVSDTGAHDVSVLVVDPKVADYGSATFLSFVSPAQLHVRDDSGVLHVAVEAPSRDIAATLELIRGQ